jgi:hypothetical protein
MSTSRPATSTIWGVENAFRKSPSALTFPFSTSWKSIERGVFQTVRPVRLSSATTYCTSLPSKCMMSRSRKRIGDEPAPRKWLHSRSRRVHSTLPDAASSAAVPGDPKVT